MYGAGAGGMGEDEGEEYEDLGEMTE